MNLRADRSALGISQSRLARMSGVSRFKICTFELGSGALKEDELDRIKTALLAEADRLRTVSRQIDLGRARPAKRSDCATRPDDTEKSR
jgi:predicted transcriptional regulator